MSPLNLLPCDGEALYYDRFFGAEESDRWFAQLRQEIQWKHEPIVMFGRRVLQPRLTAWYGDADKDIRYSGITMRPLPWNDFLLRIKERVEFESGVRFTSVLLNHYRDGRDSVGWHRDDEKELGRDPVIASVSFGAVRTFRFRHREDPALKPAVDLTHGSFLLMRGATQHCWDHCLPKRSVAVGPRVNLTFRAMS